MMYCYPPGFQNQGEAYHLGMTPEQEMLVKTTQIWLGCPIAENRKTGTYQKIKRKAHVK